MDSATVLSLCKKYGPLLALPASSILDGVALMCAFAENESSFGANATPRHEIAYDVGGRYSNNPMQASLLEAYGSKAAYSYGVWQTLPCNALGVSPAVLDGNEDAQALAFVRDFNQRVLPRAQTLGEMGQVYNAGHVAKPPQKPLPGVVRYCVDLQRNYTEWFAKLKQEKDDAPSIA